MSDFKNLKNDLKIINDKIKDTSELKERIGKHIANSIKERMVDGQGTDGSGSTAAYKPLKDSTIKHRKYLQKKGKLSGNTTPDKSNQISSGLMYDSIDYDVIKNEIKIGPKNTRNQEIAGYNEKNGRPTFYLTNEEQKDIDELVNEFIDDALSSKK